MRYDPTYRPAYPCDIFVDRGYGWEHVACVTGPRAFDGAINDYKRIGKVAYQECFGAGRTIKKVR